MKTSLVKVFFVLFIGLVCEAIGFAFLGRGVREVPVPATIDLAAVLGMIQAGATNGHVWLGLLFEALFFSTVLLLMTRRDVSFVLPLTTLGMVFTTLAARIVLNEQVSTLRWAGVLLIVLGSTFVTYSEQGNAKPAACESK